MPSPDDEVPRQHSPGSGLRYARTTTEMLHEADLALARGDRALAVFLIEKLYLTIDEAGEGNDI